MEFMLLIYNDERRWAALSGDERSAIVREYLALTDEMRDHGVYITGAPLEPTPTATSVRVRDEELLVVDGPFAETKEQLGGYFLLEVSSDDEARMWAAKVPAARYGTVEVRAVLAVGVEAPA